MWSSASPVQERLRAQSVRDGACLRWTGTHTPKGYGHISIEGKTRQVHRVVYELTVGPIPKGLEIDHLCHVRDCIEIAHLEPVTHAENIRRRRPGSRRPPPPDRCPRGHLFTPENTLWTRRCAGPDPDRKYRKCRSCKRVLNASYKKRMREERARRVTVASDRSPTDAT